eukprot:TRINITY_DN65024_c0_g1_i1.p1 TRINITY_DN65024_c0_g1~~TRINITY_DN65024_c0_g1_i1.p1  ORF type:complete len:173 (+),score=41.01 TRINITY_DN65024_c0_g1_i1:58-519(+)
MLNDVSRNRFYWEALKKVVEGKRVLDVGAGSGLLALLAAKLGAAHVIALEANSDMAKLAKANVQQNNFEHVVDVVHGLSTGMEFDEEEKVDVVVSETMGTLLNGESIVDYLEDARTRLALPGATVIPAGGAQFCTLIMSPSIWARLSRLFKMS